MKIIVSDTNQTLANEYAAIILEECPTAEIVTRIETLSASVTYSLSNDYDIISRSTIGLSNAVNEGEGDTA